ncbi:TonB-dependent receptor [Pseudoflavitalea sp. X16]|uniref:SusC/RagA family TonB-linked outer membrane protein n=1 Tax=Paraflavitalea devenefica TaxID=2716334 RepID=UPI001423E38D|nr:TonB-dependent receptor [Paraflavitalea devenefica]NII29374.1 TonB-dependent receptor [Paraflavitalea devenefica]
MKVLCYLLLFFGLVIHSAQGQGGGVVVTGTVSSTGNVLTLAGASIREKGKDNTTKANANGGFTIRVADSNSILSISHVGYQTKEIGLKGRTTIAVVLEPLVLSMDGVVVIGYGTTTKKDLTGAVGQVGVTDLQKAPVISFDQALAGRVAGVQVSSEDGQPGSEGFNIVIRGANSLTQSNAPLYVIDGFPTEYLQLSAINPEDIKSINVLKDASATAIYGARGANGVIVIETKRGSSGKPEVTYSGSFGFQQVGKTIPVMSPYEFVKYELERNPTASTDLYLSGGKTLEDYRNVEGTNWQDLLFRRSTMQIHNIALRGGNNDTKYSISGSVYDQEGVIINTGQSRYQARVALDQKISNKISAGINFNYSKTGYYGQIAANTNAGNGASSYLMYATWGYRPINRQALDDVDDLEGELIDDDINHTSDYRVNPIISVKNEYRRNKISNLVGNAYITVALADNLKLRITGGIDSRLQRSAYFYNSLTSRGNPDLPVNKYGQFGNVTYSERSTWLNENTLTWTKLIHQKHKLDLLAGATVQGSKAESFGFTAQQVPNGQLGIYDLGSGTPLTNTSSASESSLVSFLSRVNYGFKSKYLFTASFRADASSKFAPENRWGYFPSAAFAWRISEEPWMSKIKAISEAKLRTSYGVTGNNRVGDFARYPSLSSPLEVSYSFNNGSPSPGMIQSSMGNEALKWETTSQIDLGLDVGLFENRLSLTVEVYEKTTSNLLLNASLPYLSGFNSIVKNIGKIRNRGLEISLNSTNIQSRSFTWESSFNISFNRNKVLELTDNQKDLRSAVSWEAAFNTVPLYIAELNQPAGRFYGFLSDGLYQLADFDVSGSGVYTLKPSVPSNGTSRASIQPGDMKYKDLTGDSVVNESDKVVIGNGIPRFIGGFNNNFTYGNFTLNVFFQWSYGNDIYNANRMMFEGNMSAKNSLNQYATYTNRWTMDNQGSRMFRAGGQGPNGYYSDYYLEDGSYLRLKTISLSYALPQKLVKKASFKDLRLSVTAQNIYTWTNYSGMDPEVSVRNSTLTPGFDFSAYPQAKTLVVGLKATF